jgi:hypothetical protein
VPRPIQPLRRKRRKASGQFSVASQRSACVAINRVTNADKMVLSGGPTTEHRILATDPWQLTTAFYAP